MPLVRTLKNLLTLAALVLLCSISGAAVWHAVRTTPVDRTAEEREAFFVWLRTGNPLAISPAMRRHWVRRLELDLSDKYDWQARWLDLGRTEQDHVADNLAELVDGWLGDQLQRYQNLPVKRRQGWVDGRVEEYMSWRPLLAAAASNEAGLWHEVSQRLRAMIDRRSQTERRQFDELMSAIQRAMFKQLTRGLLPATPLREP